MRLLLDTHVWLWAVLAPEKISAQARDALEDPRNTLLISAASAWEIAQAVCDDLLLVSADRALTQYSASILWAGMGT